MGWGTPTASPAGRGGACRPEMGEVREIVEALADITFARQTKAF
ncbi:MAG: hypothetical protein U0441_08210 [Polyangiaceae bacterium]